MRDHGVVDRKVVLLEYPREDGFLAHLGIDEGA